MSNLNKANVVGQQALQINALARENEELKGAVTRLATEVNGLRQVDRFMQLVASGLANGRTPHVAVATAQATMDAVREHFEARKLAEARKDQPETDLNQMEFDLGGKPGAATEGADR